MSATSSSSAAECGSRPETRELALEIMGKGPVRVRAERRYARGHHTENGPSRATQEGAGGARELVPKDLMKDKKALANTSLRSLAAKHPVAATGVGLVLAATTVGVGHFLRAPRPVIDVIRVPPTPSPFPPAPQFPAPVPGELASVSSLLEEHVWLRQQVRRLVGDAPGSTTSLQIRIRAQTKAQVRELLEAIRGVEGGPAGGERGRLKSIDYTAGEIVFTDKNGVDHKVSLKSLSLSAAGGAGVGILIGSGSDDEEDSNGSVPPERPVFQSQQEFERFVGGSLEASLTSRDWMDSETNEETIVVVPLLESPPPPTGGPSGKALTDTSQQ